MPFQVGPLELVVVLVIALIILGPKKLPSVGRSLGRGMREFKDSISGPDHDHDHDADDDDKAALPTRSETVSPAASEPASRAASEPGSRAASEPGSRAAR